MIIIDKHFKRKKIMIGETTGGSSMIARLRERASDIREKASQITGPLKKTRELLI